MKDISEKSSKQKIIVEVILFRKYLQGLFYRKKDPQIVLDKETFRIFSMWKIFSELTTFWLRPRRSSPHRIEYLLEGLLFFPFSGIFYIEDPPIILLLYIEDFLVVSLHIRSFLRSPIYWKTSRELPCNEDSLEVFSTRMAFSTLLHRIPSESPSEGLLYIVLNTEKLPEDFLQRRLAGGLLYKDALF